MMMTTTRRSLRTSRNRCHEPCPEGSRTRRPTPPEKTRSAPTSIPRREAHRTTRVVTKLSTPRPRRTRFCMRRGARSSRLAPSWRTPSRTRATDNLAEEVAHEHPEEAAKRAFAGALKDDLATKSAWCVEPLRRREDVMKQRVSARRKPSSDEPPCTCRRPRRVRIAAARRGDGDDGYGKAEAIPGSEERRRKRERWMMTTTTTTRAGVTRSAGFYRRFRPGMGTPTAFRRLGRPPSDSGVKATRTATTLRETRAERQRRRARRPRQFPPDAFRTGARRWRHCRHLRDLSACPPTCAAASFPPSSTSPRARAW